MGDSDEEYDRRRARDKFRGERSDYERRPRDHRDRRRGADEWNDRRRENNWDWSDKRGRDTSWDSRKRGGDYYRDNERQRRDSGGRQMSPPMKRNRRDWDSSYGDEYQGYNTGANTTPVGGPWGPGSTMQMGTGNEPGKHGTPNISGDQGGQIPVMMTFKQFILAQEDDIKDSEGIRRFQEYKTEFKRTQISDFFVLHKEEEWFREKYQPVEASKHNKEVQRSLKSRLRVFLDLLDKGHLDEIRLDNQNADEIMNFLDKVVIKLEGGNDNDLSVLDISNGTASGDGLKHGGEEKTESQNQETVPLSPSSVPLPDDPPPEMPHIGENDDFVARNLSVEQKKLEEEANAYHQSKAAAESQKDNKSADSAPAKSGSAQSGSKKEKRRKHREPYHYDDDDDEDESESDSDSDVSEPAPPGEDSDQAGTMPVSEDEVKEGVSSTSVNTHREVEPSRLPPHSNETEGDEDSNLKPPGVEDDAECDVIHSEEPAPPGSEASDIPDESNEAVSVEKDKELMTENNAADSLPSTTNYPFSNRIGRESDDTGDVESRVTEKEKMEDDSRVDESKAVDSTTEEVKREQSKPRVLHKTLSLFLRNVPPSIAKNDIVAVCKRYSGFLRVAMADPSPDRRFFRRAWITFDPTVNIKDICWNLSNIRIKEIETNPVVNRDLSKRIRAITGITLAKDVAEFDLRFASKLVATLDEKYKLYQAEDTESKDEMDMEASENGEAEIPQGNVDTTDTPRDNDPRPIPIPNQNPILSLVPQLPEEDISEKSDKECITEDEKKDELPPQKENPVDFCTDADLFKVLDKLVLYLRVVHSLDYYNGSDYPHEDDMPNRCGIIHIRGMQPEKPSYGEVLEWKKNQKAKLSHHFISDSETITDEEAVKLGKKDSTIELENFVSANTEELAKDKWYCQLSGKKFKGPEFVRKHIFNKHCDKLEAVKTEVEFFNKYLYDPRRPHFPEQTASSSGPNSTSSSNQGSFTPQQPMYQMGWNPRGPHVMYGPRSHFTPPSYGGFRGGPDMHSRVGHTYPPKPRRGGMIRDPRSIITYKDLDAPDAADFF